MLVLPIVSIAENRKTDLSSPPGNVFPFGWRKEENFKAAQNHRPECRTGEAEKEWLMERKDQEVNRGQRDSFMRRCSYTSQDHPAETQIKTETTWLSLGNMGTRHTPWQYFPGPYLIWRKRHSPRAYKSQWFPKSVPFSLYLSPTGKYLYSHDMEEGDTSQDKWGIWDTTGLVGCSTMTPLVFSECVPGILWSWISTHDREDSWLSLITVLVPTTQPAHTRTRAHTPPASVSQ